MQATLPFHGARLRVQNLRQPPLILGQKHRVSAPAVRPLEPPLIDLDRHRPDPRALDRFGIEAALKLGVLPLQPAGAITPVAAERMRDFRRARPALERALGPVICCRARRDDIERRIVGLRAPSLASRAACRTARVESCRGWSGGKLALATLAISAVVVLAAVSWPAALVAAVTAWSALTLISVTGLRLIAALAQVRHARQLGQTWASQRPMRHPEGTQPSISILVPLFDETNIAERLVARLARLEYPRHLLDILLILEADDARTRAALRTADLPGFMRIVEVPAGEVRTKPRAMNYALDFARGQTSF